MKIDTEFETTVVDIDTLKPGECLVDDGSVEMVIKIKPFYEVDPYFPIVTVDLSTGTLNRYQKGYKVAKQNFKAVKSDE